MNHIGTKNIETERLILRKWRIEDANDVFFANQYPHKNIEETKSILKIWIEGYNKLNTYEWGIELKNCNKIIGVIFVLNQDEKTKSCDISYTIAKIYRNKGYATEALHSVLRYLINDVGYTRVEAGHFIDNPASGKVMEKAGMKYETTRKQNIYNCETGTCKDSVIYRITKDDLNKESGTHRNGPSGKRSERDG
jgi:ribosomal-protein-alanine N-acetyltransferase